MVLMFSTVIAASAQTALETQKPLDNVYFGVNAGVNTPLSFDKMFPLNTTIGVKLGKDFTPVFGMNIEGTMWLGSNRTQTFVNGVSLNNRFDIAHNAIRATNVGVNGTINLSNLLCGYIGEPRKFEVITETGLGWGHVFNANFGDFDALTAKTGVMFAFNLGDNKAHQLYVEPAVLWNLNSNGYNVGHRKIAFDKNEAFLGLSVGYVYKFKTSNGTHNFKLYDVGAMQNEINNLRQELAKKPGVQYVDKIVEKEKIVNVTNGEPYVVLFAFNDAQLDGDAKAILDKVPTNVTVDVVGTASPEGTDNYNKALSERRAAVVADYLTNRGVKVASISGAGVKGNASNRLVYVTVK